VGYLLLFLFGLAVCLFCWLSYSSVAGATRLPHPPAEDQFLDCAAEDITPPLGAGSG
jgi:hypothetical protein